MGNETVVNLSFPFPDSNSSQKDAVWFTPVMIVKSVLSSICLLLYFTVWIIICLNYKKFKSHFYLYLITAGIPDMTSLCLDIIFCVPAIAMKNEFHGRFGTFLGTVRTFVLLAQVLHVFAIALNRTIYASVKSYHHYKKSFGNARKTVTAISFIFAITFLVIGVDQYLTCSWYFSMDSLFWMIYCTDSKFSLLGSYIDFGLYTGFAILSIVLYIITWLLIKKRQSQVSAGFNEIGRKREIRFLKQFSCITGALILYLMVTTCIFFTLSSNIAAIVSSVGDDLNIVINPIVYLIFDQKLKDCFKKTKLIDLKKTTTS